MAQLSEATTESLMHASSRSFSPAGAEEEDIARAHLDALAGGGGIEVLGRDRVTLFEPVAALEGEDVEEDAAPGDPFRLLIDGVVVGAMEADVARGEAVVELVVVVDVREAVPLG